MEGDGRAVTAAESERIVREIRALTSPLDGVRGDVTGGINRPRMERNAAEALFATAQRLVEGLGVGEITGAEVGGSAVTPTHSLEPFDTEHEGYMGNYGNTLDRWYRRAAVVVWPEEKSFAACAEAGSAWALRRLLDRIEAGDLDKAREDAASLQGFWRQVEPALLAPALQVAAGLDEAAAARVVLAPFRIEMLRPAHAPLLATLARQYGDRWLLDLIRLWESSNRFAGPERMAWISEEMLALCQALREQAAHPTADVCAELTWGWLTGRIDTWVGFGHPGRRRSNLAELGAPLARVLEAASHGLGESIVAQLRTSQNNVTELLVPALRAHQGPTPPALVALAHDCREQLGGFLDSPAWAEGDWSISWTGCGCELCERARKLPERRLRTHSRVAAGQDRPAARPPADRCR